jgi:hypothetical protein
LDVLVREAIQNSFDQRINAKAPNLNPPSVVFRLKDLTADESSFIYSTVLGDSPESLFPGIARAESLARSTALYITDINTKGLSGTTNPLDHEGKESSNFYRFFWPSKRPASANAGEGGTYGVGRHILHAMSEAETLLVYSKFVGPSGALDERFMGVTLADPVGNLMGVHFWCSKDSDDAHPRPIEGPQARDAALRAGFDLKGLTGEITGTSIAVLQPVKSVIDLDDPKRGFEDRQLESVNGIRRALNLWAWPHIVDRTLQMGTAQGEEEPQYFTRNLIPELADWVAAYESSSSDVIEQIVTITTARKQVGKLRYVKRLVGEAESQALVIPQSGIALMRGVKFIVKYLPAQIGDDGFGVRGVFVAEPGAVDEVFRNSEPATHDSWTTGGQTGSPEYPRLVESTFAAIARHVKSTISSSRELTRQTTRGLATIAKHWAESYFSNSGELQPDADFKVLDPNDFVNPPKVTGDVARPGTGSSIPQSRKDKALQGIAGSVKYISYSVDEYITEFSWEVKPPQDGDRKLSFSVKARHLTADGPEAQVDPDELAIAQLDSRVVIGYFQIQVDGTSKAARRNIAKPASTLKIEIPESEIPNVSKFFLTIGVRAPIGAATDVEVELI